MSLINKALKQEQQRRSGAAGPVAPMVARALGPRSRSDRGPLLLLGFTFAGIFVAGLATAVIYFGSSYLDGPKIVKTEETSSSFATSSVTHSSETQFTDLLSQANTEDGVESLIESLSSSELASIQKMLLEKRISESQTREFAEHANNEDAGQTTSTGQQVVQIPSQAIRGEEQDRIQDIIDDFSVQGIRKAGQNSRIFLNGKIQKIGSVVDNALGLKIVGFTDAALIFVDRNGFQYEKTL